MEFRRELHISKFKNQLNIQEKVMLVGSCFTELLGDKLKYAGFDVFVNPNGNLFNPASISGAISDYISNRKFLDNDVFFNNESWMSWMHHSQFSHPDKETLLQKINDETQKAHLFLMKCNWLVVTLGSSWIYQLLNGEVVANCHKVPADQFRKSLLDPEELMHILDNLVKKLQLFNPGLKIILTISPVRHLRDGFTENNQSKAVLIHCTHKIVEKYQHIFYFPSYELIIDDLRDYRFFSEDMVHPNHIATEYVWNKFEDSFIDEISKEVIKEIKIIKSAKSHRPFHPESESHQIFLKKFLKKSTELKERYPFLDLSEELEYFGKIN